MPKARRRFWSSSKFQIFLITLLSRRNKISNFFKMLILAYAKTFFLQKLKLYGVLWLLAVPMALVPIMKMNGGIGFIPKPGLVEKTTDLNESGTEPSLGDGKKTEPDQVETGSGVEEGDGNFGFDYFDIFKKFAALLIVLFLGQEVFKFIKDQLPQYPGTVCMIGLVLVLIIWFIKRGGPRKPPGQAGVVRAGAIIGPFRAIEKFKFTFCLIVILYLITPVGACYCQNSGTVVCDFPKERLSQIGNLPCATTATDLIVSKTTKSMICDGAIENFMPMIASATVGHSDACPCLCSVSELKCTGCVCECKPLPPVPIIPTTTTERTTVTSVSTITEKTLPTVPITTEKPVPPTDGNNENPVCWICTYILSLWDAIVQNSWEGMKEEDISMQNHSDHIRQIQQNLLEIQRLQKQLNDLKITVSVIGCGWAITIIVIIFKRKCTFECQRSVVLGETAETDAEQGNIGQPGGQNENTVQRGVRSVWNIFTRRVNNDG